MDFANSILFSNQSIYGLVLILITPGFAFICALFPRNEDLPFIDRIALSVVFSVAMVILSSLFLDNVIGIDTTGLNILITIITITLIFIVIWGIRIIYYKHEETAKNKPGSLNYFIAKISVFSQKTKQKILFIIDKYFYK